MALTVAQLADVRRYAGYPLSGTTQLTTANNDTVYLVFGMRQMSLYERLTTLSAAEETVLVTNYLANLATLEQAIPTASQNLDTSIASVWTWNKNEVADRKGLFKLWCREMCDFIGLSYGPGLGSGGLRIVRG